MSSDFDDVKPLLNFLNHFPNSKSKNKKQYVLKYVWFYILLWDKYKKKSFYFFSHTSSSPYYQFSFVNLY